MSGDARWGNLGPGGQPFRVIICGSRRLTRLHYPRVAAALNHFLKSKLQNAVVLSGAAKGADELGEMWAASKGIPVERYPADRNRFGKSAGPIRNVQVLEKADALICFDGGGPGSRRIVSEALHGREGINEKGKRVDVRVIDCRANTPEPSE